MINPPLPANESGRLAALSRYSVSAEAASALRDFAVMAASVCGAPIATISLVDKDKQWIKAQVGFSLREIPRDFSFCAHTILQSEPFIVRNLLADKRFASNPLVVSDPEIRSYAGVPLVTPDGFAIGAVGVMSQSPLSLSSAQKDALRAVARQAMGCLEAQRQTGELVETASTRDQYERELRLNKNWLDIVAANAPMILFALDKEGVFTLLEGKGLRMLGIAPGEGVGRPIAELFADAPQMAEYFQIALRGQTTSYVIEVRGRAYDVRHSPLRGADGQIVGVIGVASDTTEYRKAEEALKESEQRYRRLFASAQRQTQEQALLDTVRTAMAREVDLPALFRTVVESIARTFGYTLVSLYMRRGDTLYLQHQVGYTQVIPEIHIADGVIGRVARSGKPVLIRNVRDDPSFLGAVESIVSEICVPLFDENQAVGVLNVESTNGVALLEADMQLMLALSDHINVTIGKVRLLTESRRRNQWLTALHETALDLINRLELDDLLSAVITRAAQLLGTEHGFIYLVEPENNVVRIKVAVGLHAKYVGLMLGPGEGIAGKVWQTAQPLVVEDYSTWEGRSEKFPPGETYAIAAVPLNSRNQVIGVLGIARVEPGQGFTSDDVELLTRCAQLASIALENARLYTAAQHELAERNRTERALAAANTELEQALLNAQELAIASQSANASKGAFIANMSHEIRTPLSAVLGFTELLQGTPLSVEQTEYVEQIRLSTARLLQLINNVLDFSKTEAGRLELDTAEFDLVELTNEALDSIMPTAIIKGIRLSIDTSADVPRILVGDAVRLRQVLLNLLSNAVKFTDNGEVRLSMKVVSRFPDRALIKFSVSDTGIGIPPDKRSLIFEPFMQADDTVTRKYGGTGLGLAIAHDLVQKFGGELWVDSEPGKGSVFHFTAMLGLPAGESPSADNASARPGIGRRVLLVEDNTINQRVITRMLEKRGYEVMVVNNGQAAVAATGQLRFDVVLMDVQMPEVDGLNATIAIRAREREEGGHVPIIALTAYAMPSDRERCLEAGMDDFVPKPVKADDLQQAIERLAHLYPSSQ